MLVVGLGNPGRKYEGNRHNVGFTVVDELHRADCVSDWREKFSGLWAQCAGTAANGYALLKPQTYMNASGDCVQPAMAFLKFAPVDLLVVHDELDLPFGDVRLKRGGGHAGHNGVRSVIQRLGTPDFMRVRVGVGRPPTGFGGEVADYVLQDFDATERAELPGVVARAIEAVRRILKDGPDAIAKSDNSAPRR